MTKRILLAGLVLIELSAVPAWAQQQQIDDCSDKKGGWKTICLSKKSEDFDVTSTNVYWTLQNRIQNLTNHGVSEQYVTQLRSLLKRNELDFITYSESYCNMQVVLSDVQTELNKILSCAIHTSKLRVEEMNRIIDAISKKEEGNK